MHIEPSYCPFCGTKNDLVSSTPISTKTLEPSAATAPKENDITLCMTCGNWCLFDDQARMIKPDEKTAKWLEEDEGAKRIHATWRDFRGSNMN